MKYLLLTLGLLISISATAQTKKQVIGCWTMPARAGENLRLDPDGNFSFNDYSAMSKSFLNLYGTWSLKGKTVTLMYDERKQQRFTLKKDNKGKWVLVKVGGFRFVKAATSDCSG